MTIKQSAIEIYAALGQLHADYAACATIDGFSETVEFVALGKSIDALHSTLNSHRLLLGMTWEEFLSFIGQDVMPFSGGTNKDNPPPPGGG